MSANLEEMTVVGKLSRISLPVRTQIGNLLVQTAIHESHQHSVQVTDHPVESGAQITDHSFRKPVEIVLECGWSNSTGDAIALAASGDASVPVTLDPVELFMNNGTPTPDFIGVVYSRLLALQDAREPLDVQTGLRTYKNMLITSLHVTRDQKTSNVLMVTATLREIIIVSTLTTTLPPQANQKFPESTAEVKSVGTKQLIPGKPSPGGSYHP